MNFQIIMPKIVWFIVQPEKFNIMITLKKDTGYIEPVYLLKIKL